MASDRIRTIFGIIGNIISICMFLSPLPTFVKIIKWRSTRGFAPYTYVMTSLSCALWVLYGLPFVNSGLILVVSVNGFGFVTEIIYSLIFLIFTPKKSERLRLLALMALCTAFFVTLTACSLSLEKKHKGRRLIIGIICVLFNIGMYASPLMIMKRVIVEKSVKYMPLAVSTALLANGCAWVIYGLFPFDVNIVVPNGIGAVFAFLQIVLYACYYRTTNWDDQTEDEYSDAAGKQKQTQMAEKSVRLDISNNGATSNSANTVAGTTPNP